MPHYMIRQVDPVEGTIEESYGPVEAISPEEAVRQSEVDEELEFVVYPVSVDENGDILRWSNADLNL